MPTTAPREGTEDVEILKRACHAMAFVADRLDPADLDRPTPCPGWAVGQVLDHVVRSLDLAAALLDGNVPGPARGRGASDVRRSSRRLILAADAADLTAKHETPIGRLSGADIVAHATLDALAHAWDVAVAVRMTEAHLDDYACERALRYAQRHIPDTHRGQHLALAIEVETTATAEARLVAFLGRDPRWRPPALAHDPAVPG